MKIALDALPSGAYNRSCDENIDLNNKVVLYGKI